MLTGRLPRVLAGLACVGAVVLALDSVPSSVRPTAWLLWDVDRGGYDAATRALGELARRGTDAIVVELIARLERGHQMRWSIEDTLGAIGETAIPRLTVMLENGQEEPRRQAAVALGKTKLAAAYAPLAKAITNPATTPMVRGWAVGALRMVPGAESERLLLEILRGDGPDALTAASALGDRKSDAGLTEMDSLCGRQQDAHTRGNCMAYIGRIGSPDSARVIAGRLGHEPSAYVRFEMTRFLGHTDLPEVSSALDAAAGARHLEVIANAHQYFLRVEPPLDDRLIIAAYQRLGSADMGKAMQATGRPALMKAVADETAQPIIRPKTIEVR